MKCVIPEISWHNRDPVLSVDIQPTFSTAATNDSEFYRVASGGTDSHVLIWYLTQHESGTINLDLAADLTRHQRAVNVVRWSPSGEFLASGDDESVIFIWKLKNESEAVNILETTNEQDKEIWLTYKILRGHMEDVYDLCWSPNSQNLISGSVDNSAMLWDVLKGKSTAILNDHKSFVQGVAWDPQNQLLATLSTDRYMRVFDSTTKKVISRSSKCTLPVAETSPLYNKASRIYHDDTLQTFYRRLCFSPDGELIIAPSGVAEIIDGSTPIHTTYVYTRNNTKQPAIILPSPDQYTIAVRCCPLFYKLREYDETNPPVIPLPYRMIFAVATKSSVYLYDTQQHMPFGLISNIHYTRLTDLTWSSDGTILIVSSTDGFCTLITFADEELGEVYVKPKDIKTNDDDVKPKSPNVFKSEEQSQNEKLLSSDQKAATPIAFRRKPKESVNDNNQNVPKNEGAKAINDDKPTPIAFRRKPKDVSSNGKQLTNQQTIDEKPTPIAFKRKPKSDGTIVSEKPLEKIATEAVIELPSTIISSEEKFVSPEKTIVKPATPIQVRREPRKLDTPTTNDAKAFNIMTLIKSPDMDTNMIPVSPIPSTPPTQQSQKRSTSKKATPIAVRRHRKLISSPPSARLNAKDAEEEALDAWPIDEPKPSSISMGVLPVDDDVAGGAEIVKPVPKSAEMFAMDVEVTEDMRLVYDGESQEDDQPTENPEIVREHVTPNSKTPRRVELRTISTPKSKSKKKL